MSIVSDELLTAKEVAEYLKVTRNTVARWTDNGVLHPVRIQGTVRYRRKDLDELINQERTK